MLAVPPPEESEGAALLGISLMEAAGIDVDGIVESEGIGIVLDGADVDAAALVGVAGMDIDGIELDGVAGSDGMGMLMSLRRNPLGEASAEIVIAAAEPATTATNATAEITEEDFRTVVTLCFFEPAGDVSRKAHLLRR